MFLFIIHSSILLFSLPLSLFYNLQLHKYRLVPTPQVPTNQLPTTVSLATQVLIEQLSTSLIFQPFNQPYVSSNWPIDNLSSPFLLVRKSTQPKKLPTYLKDYHCNLIYGSPLPFHSTPYPLQHCISYHHLSPIHHDFFLFISSHYEP